MLVSCAAARTCLLIVFSALPAPAALSAGVPISPGPAAAAPALALFGPALLCHPFDIGELPSLPFGRAAFETDPTLKREQVLAATLLLLDSSDHSLQHMETMRRAVITLVEGRDDRAAGLSEGLLVALEARHERAVSGHAANPTAARSRQLALASLDLAYAIEALQQLGQDRRPSVRAWQLVQQALAADPDDGALHLAVSLIAHAQGRNKQLFVALAGALERAPDEQSLLCRNLCRTLGANLGAKDRAALVARVARELPPA